MKTEGTPLVKRTEFNFNCPADKNYKRKKTLRGNFMKNYVNLLFKKVILASFVSAFGLGLIAQEVEEVVVTAEKRSESLQDISQAVTALTETDIEEKNITSFVDLSAIVPGVTVAKNEGYKTIISIRGVGNETNQPETLASHSISHTPNEGTTTAFQAFHITVARSDGRRSYRARARAPSEHA